MKRKSLIPYCIGFLVLWCCSSLVAQQWSGIVDPTRAVDWSAAGVPSGIPNRTTVCATINAATYGNGTNDATSGIQTALNSCPSAQVVLLSSGTFRINGSLTIPSNVVLRGAGPDQTKLDVHGSSQAVIMFGGKGDPSSGTSTAITGGNSKGSNVITVASTSGISVGKLLLISQNDLSYMNSTGDLGACGWCNGGVGGDSGQISIVTAISGTSVTIDPPLLNDYSAASNSQKAYPFSASCSSAGLESLKLYANNTGYTVMIQMQDTINSWVKNVEDDFADNAHLYIFYGLHNTVRDSFFHDGFNHGPGGTDNQLDLAYKSTANLIENNIFYRQHVSIMFEWGPAGNVVAYNYSTGNYHYNGGSGDLNWMINDFNFHGAHPMMNLFEGNIGDKFQPDSTWGSSSHSTLLRNYFTGSRKYVPPLNARGALQTANAQQETGNTFAYSLDFLTTYTNMIGDISGSPYLLSSGAANMSISPTANGSNPACYRIGYNADTDAGVSPNNANATIFIHGLYDCVGNTFQWDSSHPNHTLPASFYLGAQPSWFSTPWGKPAWPPIGPDVNGGAGPSGHVYKIPAQLCFENSTKDATGRPIFNATNCYGGSGNSSNVLPPTNLVAVVN